MKAIVINGSGRKNWNTAQLCQACVKGLEEEGADVELIHITDLSFKGCVSCYACHLKSNMDKYRCFYKDSLTEVLDKLLDADVIVLSSPIFYGEVCGQIRALMERLLFPLDTYYAKDGKRVVKRDKKVYTGFIYSMNASKKQLEYYKMDQNLHRNAGALSGIFNAKCEELYCCDTLQFSDYDKYTVNIFDPNHKKKHHDEQFPKDLEDAYEMGRRLALKVLKKEEGEAV